MEWIEIGERLGTTASTAHYHYARVKDQESRLDHARAAADSAFVSALAWSGARVTELCDLNVENVDLAHEKFRIPDSKTPTGVCDVDMTPALMAAVQAHFASRPDLPATSRRSRPATADAAPAREPTSSCWLRQRG